MAAQSTYPAPTGRYIKAYLIVWGVLATGGLGYLASLAWPTDQMTAQAPAPIAEPEPEPGLHLANRALAELGTVRRTIGDMQKDIGQVRDTLEQRDAQDKVVQSRIAALEERVATPPVAAVTPEVPPRQRAAEKAKTDRRQVVEQRTPRRVITINPSTPAAPTDASPDTGPPVALETGSIVAPPPPIAFGEAVVTPAKTAFGVQLAAGPSLDALRLSWSMLVERHGALGALQPRFVPPKADGTGPYRLVAGPLPSRADADKVCTEMGVGRNGCFSTTFIGEPL